MIASALPARLAAPTVDRQYLPDQNVLLVSFDQYETDRFATLFDDLYQVFLAGSERRLFAVLQSQAIHVIIINAGTATIPETIRLCARLKSSPQSAHLPVILLIPGSHLSIRIGCLKAGADACIEKPISRDHLFAQLRNLLANRNRLKSYFSQPFLSAIDTATGTGENLAFVNRISEFISANLHDPELKVDALAQWMNISLPTLYRKIRQLSKNTPNALVNAIRLKKAAELLSTGEYKVFTIARMVGFPSRSNFGKAFVKQFGLTPTEYVQMIRKHQ